MVLLCGTVHASAASPRHFGHLLGVVIKVSLRTPELSNFVQRFV
jgi:hypothetical protein